MAAGLVLAMPGSADAKVRFRPCGEASCGVLSVPLDHSGAVPGRLSLRVKRYPSFDPGPHGLVLVLAGAPGEAAFETEELLLETPGDDLVRFDQRGTGPGALRCRDLEAATPTDAGREAAACATLLGDRRAFFRTTDTVEDIEALRAELGAERLTLIGPGYGGYVAQRYAMRYPDRVERLLFVSPVDAAGLDPLYVDSMAAARRVLPSDVLADTARLVEQLAREPLEGQIVGPTGHRRTAFLTRQELLYILTSADEQLLSQAEYPAAVVSALRGDAAPILRMKRRAVAQPLAQRPGFVSTATYAATLCEEVRFPSALTTETAMDPSLVAPFDPGTLVRSDLMKLCRAWPRSSGPPPDPGPMPDVPVLVLAAPERVRLSLEGAQRAAARFPRAKLLESRGALGVFGSGLSDCATIAAVRFLTGQRVRDRCPDRRPVLPPAMPAPESLTELPAAGGVPGRRGKLLYALSVTFGDLFDSFYADALLGIGAINFDAGLRSGGLRGGSFTITERRFRLKRYEYVPRVRFSGNWKTESNRLGPLHIDGPGSLDGVVQVREVDDLTFGIRGRLAGRPVRTRVVIRTRLANLFEESESGESESGGSARAATLSGLLR
jgi:pimeloyl-ACP methyl ester carboxylesterase